MESNQFIMPKKMQAHQGATCLLETSDGLRRAGVPRVGDTDRLLSAGTDERIKIWAVEVASNRLTVNIILINTILCQGIPSHMVMYANSVAYTIVNDG